ncbi:MAG: flagellar rod assembly protein/muramidase FlgJ [Firmicutes bacterium]|nr:flagellar rod assembly protein/muramidase FlgJ [Bacillota bacterium]
MRINSGNMIQANTVVPNSGGTTPDQEAGFADRLEKAVQASQVSASQAKAKGNAASAATAAEDAKLKATCQEMEAVFLNLMLKQMRETVPKGTLLGNTQAEQTFRSMLDTELTKNMAKAGGMGLADMIYRQMTKTAAAVTTVATDKGQASK